MKTIDLGSIASIITGFPFKGENYSTEGVRVVRGENVTEGSLRWDTIKCWNLPFDKFQYYSLQLHDIVVGMDGSKVGKNKAVINNDDLPLLLAQRVACIRAKKNYDQRFLYYTINNPRFEEYVFKTQTGSSVPHISRQQIEDYEVPEIDFITQSKIAKVLSDLDAKIDLNHKINSELEAMAKLIYDYWFVQFDFPDENGKPYKSSGGKMAWCEELKREIPEGWESISLDQMGEILGGSTPSKTYNDNFCIGNGQPWITPKDLSLNKGKKYITRGEYDVTAQGLKSASLRIMIKGTVLLSSRAPIGYLAIAREDVTTNQGFKSFVPTKGFETEYIYFTIQNLIPTIENNAVGSTFKEVSGSTLKSILTFRPTQTILDSYQQLIKPTFEKQNLVELENEQLTSLRDWLLPMLMNGQVYVGGHFQQKKILSQVAKSEENCVTNEQLPIPNNKKPFAKQVLAGKIVSNFKDDQHFSDIKFQKIQFLAEHIIEADLNLNYYCQAAGPYDNKFMHTIYTDLRKQKWFDRQNKKFIVLEKQGKIEDYYQGYFSPVQDRLNTLFILLQPTTEAESEIIATLYAVWNNRIISGTTATSNELIADFYRWSDRKQQYSEEQILSGIQWLKDHKMEPKGFGKLIKQAKGKK